MCIGQPNFDCCRGANKMQNSESLCHDFVICDISEYYPSTRKFVLHNEFLCTGLGQNKCTSFDYLSLMGF